MDDILGALAFALLIGGQFLAVIVVTWKRDTIFANPNERARQPLRADDGATQFQHRIAPEIAPALAQHALAQESERSDEASTRAVGRAEAAEPTVMELPPILGIGPAHCAAQYPSASVPR